MSHVHLTLLLWADTLSFFKGIEFAPRYNEFCRPTSCSLVLSNIVRPVYGRGILSTFSSISGLCTLSNTDSVFIILNFVRACAASGPPFARLAGRFLDLGSFLALLEVCFFNEVACCGFLWITTLIPSSVLNMYVY